MTDTPEQPTVNDKMDAAMNWCIYYSDKAVRLFNELDATPHHKTKKRRELRRKYDKACEQFGAMHRQYQELHKLWKWRLG